MIRSVPSAWWDLRCPVAGAVAALLSAALAATPAMAQHESSSAVRTGSTTTNPAVAQAVRAEPQAPRIDGRLDERAWLDAPPIRDFTQKDPNEGEPATEATEARVVYTDAALFVGIRAWDSRADEIAAQLTRRDEESPSDWIVIGIDSYRDRRTAFVFWVNPAGVKRDMYLFDDTDEDYSWDAVWDVATTVDDQGWSAEFRIPFSQLRFAEGEQQEFGFQVVRLISRLNEEQHWRLMPKDQSGIVSLFGDLVGIEGIKPPQRTELLPYIAANSSRYAAESGNPFATGSDQAVRVGGDLYYGVTSNLTLSATINPDFGQVEADPAVVNLSAFETFYPEKRPFFNEGLDIFRFPILLGDGDNANEQLFYTRRIGRAPQGSADLEDGYAETIQQTTILGAGKLSGKTASGWTVGLLGALTAEEAADVLDGSGARFSEVVEPRSSYFVGRVARDLRNGKTKLGFFGTAVNRALPDNLDWLRSAAYAGGFDWTHRFHDDTYEIDGWLVGSHVRGSATAIDETQRSSARYYQRSDNDYVSYDPTRTSLTGFAGQFVFSKNRGDWVYATGLDTRSPGFEVNDAGYQRDADRTIQFFWMARRWLEPGKLFRRAQVNINQYTVWNYGFDRVGTGGNINANGQFRNYWSGYFGVEQSLESLSSTALRGGPALLRPYSANWWGGFSSDSRKPIRGGISTWGQLQPASDSWNYGISPRISWRAASNMDFTLGPQVSHRFNSWQYLTRETVQDVDHYIFGQLRQTVASMTFRGNVTFTPTLSLQLYAEPFVASGAYEGFRQVADPRADHFDDRFDDFGPDRLIESAGEYAIDLDSDGTPEIDLGNPDFTFLSFRSNTVLRWEYKPGSTLFLVWQHGRTDDNDRGQFRLRQGIRDLFAADAVNTFVVKCTYWLGR